MAPATYAPSSVSGTSDDRFGGFVDRRHTEPNPSRPRLGIQGYATGNQTATVSNLATAAINAMYASERTTALGSHSRPAAHDIDAQLDPFEALLADLGAQFFRLSDLATLPVGWDGVDGMPPSMDTVQRVARIVIGVAENSLRAPVLIAPLTDGSIQVEWSDGRTRLELVVEDDGGLSADVITGVGTENRQFRELGSVDEPTVQRIVSHLAD